MGLKGPRAPHDKYGSIDITEMGPIPSNNISVARMNYRGHVVQKRNFHHHYQQLAVYGVAKVSDLVSTFFVKKKQLLLIIGVAKLIAPSKKRVPT